MRYLKLNWWHRPLVSVIKGSLAGILFLASISDGFASGADAGGNSPGTAYAFLQQEIAVTGIVTDESGLPLPGVTVLLAGTSTGVISDADGKYAINVPGGDAVLVFSFVGYTKQEVTVGNRNRISITLYEDARTLEEVVVVGYATVKKVNLTGSVSAIEVERELGGRPVVNISQILAGTAAGVQVLSSNNQPGNDDGAILIRGQGTLNNSSPLVIIDGVEASIGSINPQDVKTVSVLKDAASASIYGSRAANGAIVITTKNGEKGDLKVSYNGYVSSESIRKTLTPVSNYADYMGYVNEGLANSNQATVFTRPTIDAWRNDGGQNPLLFPNTDWIDETFRPSVATNHVISASGGSEKITLYASLGYLNNPGVLENAGLERYSGRLNVEADIKKWLKIGIQTNGFISDMGTAAKYQSDGTVVDNIFTYAAATTPGMVFRAPDGRYGAMNNAEDAAQSANNNPLRTLNQVTGNFRKNHIRTRVFGTLSPFKGFSLTASSLYEFTNELRESKPVFIDGWNFRTNTVTQSGSGKTHIYNYNNEITRNFGDIVARYENRFINNKLELGIIAGASQEKFINKYFSVQKYDLVDLNLSVINAATGDASAAGSSTDWIMRSYFGRINLAWAYKYLLEINLRSDGSSRFLADRRWGYFPSFSAAWRISEEEFAKELKNKGFEDLKLRFSYGSLGNNSVGNYEAIPVYGTSNYVYNNELAVGLAQLAIANGNLFWESTAVTDAGVDFALLNRHLTGTVDYFQKITKDILIDLPAPVVHGTSSIPKQNSATVSNKGFEISLGWQDRISDFSYAVHANFTHVKNSVTKYKGEERTLNGANVIQEGLSINSQYLLRVNRIIQTDEDVAIVQRIISDAPIDEATGKKRDPFAAYGTPELGDFLYEDTNKDGIINDADKVIVSNGANPEFYYGLNLNASYKGFDFSILFQGIAGVKEYWQSAAYNTPTVRVGYQLNRETVENRWYEGRTDATSPRLLYYTDNRNTQPSDFYLQDRSFLKIRNVQLGYTLPKSIVSKRGIEKIRVYGSLENFFTFTGYKGFDPEISGLNYPSMKQLVAGINLSF